MRRDGNYIPSIDECYEIIGRHGMLINIIRHSEQVMNVALAIVDNLHADVTVDRPLVAAASLLHDITKTRALETKERHDTTGAELLRAMGLEKVAEIVEHHVFFRDFNPGGPLEEREIVFYADKRVMHDKIVTVEERISDLVARYGTTPEHTERILKNREFILEVDKKIQSFMQTDMESAIQLIR